MTGIERLRTLAGEWDAYGLGGALAEIADEIERERAEDCYRMGIDCGTVLRVVADMEHHILGHEGMEDSPVARWARELRRALKSDTSDSAEQQKPSWHDPDSAADVTSDAPKVTRDPAEDVSMSAYDLLPEDEREAIAWVREHGGLDYVKKEWRNRVPHDRYEARRQRLLGHIAECETALGRRREIISELTHRVSDLTRENAELRRRAMPEGIEWLIEAWPRFEDNAPVKLGDMALIDGDVDMVEAVQIWIHGKPVIYGDNGSQQLEKGERVKRPSVPAADGEPLEVGQTVYSVNDGTEYKVGGIRDTADVDGDLCKIIECSNDELHIYYACFPPDKLTHQRPVLDADGVPIKVGDTVYWLEHTGAFTVISPHETHDNDGHELKCGHTVEIAREGHELHMYVHPESLHHTKPEPRDSWDALWDDIEDCAVGYESFMRRCKALAERGEQQ